MAYSHAGTEPAPPPLAIHRLRFLHGLRNADNGRGNNLRGEWVPHAHGCPIVRELSAAIEAYHIGPPVCGVLCGDRSVSPAARHGKGRARMSTSKERVNQRLKHIGPPLTFVTILDTLRWPDVAGWGLKIVQT